MKKRICAALIVMILWCVLPLTCMTIMAANDDMAFSFDLAVDGKDTKEVQTGDIITVVLRLKRTDASDSYQMYAMQDEIRYDSTFLELVEGSAVLGKGIVSTDIAMVDQYREFYMNYLSISGGEKWNAETLVGSVQFKVIGVSGVTKITSEDYLVSVKDGSDSYSCDANEVTVVISTECTVSFKSNGGSEIADQTVVFGEKIICPKDPVREGYVFSGWYADIHLTDEWDFEKDVVEGNMSLYAKWTEKVSGGMDEESGTDDKESDRESQEGEDNSLSEVPDTGDGYSIIIWVTMLVLLVLVLLLWIRNRKSKKA